MWDKMLIYICFICSRLMSLLLSAALSTTFSCRPLEVIPRSRSRQRSHQQPNEHAPTEGFSAPNLSRTTLVPRTATRGRPRARTSRRRPSSDDVAQLGGTSRYHNLHSLRHRASSRPSTRVKVEKSWSATSANPTAFPQSPASTATSKLSTLKQYVHYVVSNN